MKVKIGPYKNATERKVKVKFIPDDLYNLDVTLALVIKPALEEFKKYHGGTPANLTTEEWNFILSSMIEAFSCIINEDFTVESRRKIKKGLKHFANYYLHLWD